MRTTVTLDDDVAAALKRIARERDISFKEALNSAIRHALSGGSRSRPYQLPTYRMERRPGIDLTKALQLAASLEDEEIVRKLELRK